MEWDQKFVPFVDGEKGSRELIVDDYRTMIMSRFEGKLLVRQYLRSLEPIRSNITVCNS